MMRRLLNVQRVWRVLAASALVAALLFVEYQFHRSLETSTATYTLLLAILLLAVKWGRVETILASLLAALGLLYFFEEPSFTFKVDNWQSYVEVGSFLIVAIVVSQTALTARRRTAEALERKRETERLYELGQAMLASDSLESIAWIAIHEVIPIFGVPGAAFHIRVSDDIQRTGATEAIADDAIRDRTVVGIDPISGVSFVPVEIQGERIGCLAIASVSVSDTVLKSIASLLSTVVDRVRASEKLRAEKQVSESLLLNILPSEVADELRAKGIVSPKYFEDVTILFTDFVGFTLSTEKLAAEELVELLHDYFTAFDQIVTRYRLEKMKTIGDSYMCISGLPMRNPAHPVDMVMAAFEMLEAVRIRQRPDRLAQWKVRIGIHTGPVIAGVVGINKFAFDIWGDTVNFSSRMESSGAPNRINISERTYSRVKDFIACEHRGKVPTKDKREVDMYFANGILPGLVNGSSAAPPLAFARRYNVYFQKDPPSFPAFLLGNPAGGALLPQPELARQEA